MALNCLINFAKEETILADTKQHQRIKGIFIALCCHHRCEWQHYVGRYYIEKWGFEEGSFQILTSLTSWATCGNKHQVDSNMAIHDPETDFGQRYKNLNLSVQKREEIGNKCKLLIDQGRVMFLKENGINAKLLYFIQKEISLENVALIAAEN